MNLVFGNTVEDKKCNQQQIVHVVFDDKFIDMALRQFNEVSPGRNFPILLGPPVRLQYVKSSNVSFYPIPEAEKLFRSDACAAVIFHSLKDEYLRILKSIPPTKIVIWVGWGYDYYGRLLSGAFPDGLLLPMTKEMMQKLSPLRKMRSFLSLFKRTQRCGLASTQKFIAESLARIDYFAPVLDVEYELTRKLNPWFSSKFVSWNYGTAEDDLTAGKAMANSAGKNILVGNSATPENNHLEIFEILSDNVDLTGREIVVPLSYGDPLYRKKIVAAGRRAFGSRFVPLVDFIPKDKYIALLDTCGFAFMNHLRQQAMGNVFIMMMKGAKVFLNSHSPAYHWFIEKGAVIHSIEELVSDARIALNALNPIPSEARKVNIAITMSHCGRDVQREKTRRLVEIALGGANPG